MKDMQYSHENLVKFPVSEINVTQRSMVVSDDFNYKRLLKAWREGTPYTDVILLSRDEPPRKKRLITLAA